MKGGKQACNYATHGLAGWEGVTYRRDKGSAPCRINYSIVGD